MSGFDYPLLLEPIAVPKVWAGGRLASIPGRKKVETGEPIGESWDVSTYPGAPDNPSLSTVTKITNGRLAGTPLDKVTDMPVVVKVIDSGDKLSVQNHPDLPNEHKSEMWYLLEADPDSYLFFDFAEGVNAGDFCKLLRNEPLDEEKILGALSRYKGQKGAYFNVPAPTVHALGPGLLTFEISERSQTTYRLYDYDRPRSRGKLDIEPGCKALLNLRQPGPALDPGLNIEGASGTKLMTAFPTFCVMKVCGDKITIKSSKHQHLISAVSGKIRLTGPTPDWNIDLGYTFTCLVPPTDQPYTIEVEGGGDVFISPLAD